jgi:hypothetical protein
MMLEAEQIKNILAGGTGSAIAVWLAKATGVDLAIMFIGGVVASHIFGDPVAHFFSLQKYEAAVGFIVGFLSILVLRKLYESVQAIEAAGVGKALVDKLRKMLGV